MSPLLFLFLLPLFAGIAGKEICLYRLILTDSEVWADGWGRDYISLTANSQLLSLTPSSETHQGTGSTLNATLGFGKALGFYSFSAFDGDTVYLNFTARSNFSNEDSWYITARFNPHAPLILNGSGPGNKSQSFVASCPSNLTSVTDLKIEADSSRPYLARLSWNGTAKEYRVARQTTQDSAFVTLARTMDKFLYVYFEPNSTVKFQVSTFSDFREGSGVTLEVNSTSYPTCASQLTLHLLDAVGKGWKEGRVDVYVAAKDLQNKTSVLYKVVEATSNAMKAVYTIATPLSPLDFRVKYHAPVGGDKNLEYTLSWNGTRVLLHSGRGNKKPADGSVTVTCPKKKGQAEDHHLLNRPQEVTGRINYTIAGKQHLLAIVTSACVNNNCPTGSCIPYAYCSGGSCVQYFYDDGTACPAPDQCSNGGVCSNGQCLATTQQPNGAPCDDGNSATVNDVCTNGVCRGSTSSPSPSPSTPSPSPWFPSPSTPSPSTPSPSTPSPSTPSPSSSSDTCSYILQMYDSFGDGWKGEYINILEYLTGNPISMYLSVPANRNAQEVRFTVARGLFVYVQFVPYATDQSTLTDDSYQVVPDGGGTPVVISPPGLGVTDPTAVPGSTSFTASCSSSVSPSSPGTGAGVFPAPSTGTGTGPGTGTGTPGTGTGTGTPGTGSPCNPNPCGANAACTAVGTTSVRCTCNAGFSGNGQTCTSTGGSNCPSNCASLNRQTCQSTIGVPTCGPCNSGFTDSSGGTNSGNTQCTATSNCPSNCASLNRQTCQSGSSTCGSCNSGFVDSNGGTSPGNSQCSQQQQTGWCMFLSTPCANLNRQPCQASFNSPTCGPCLNGFTDSAGGQSSQNGNSQCTAANICSQAPDCNARNRQPCQASFNAATCGPCLSGFTVNGGNGAPTGTTTCTSTNLCANVNCASLNRQPCQASFNAATCGPCQTGFTVNGGSGAPTGTTQCTATNTCANAPNCANLNRAACQASFGQPVCGACNPGYSGSATGTTACTATDFCQNNNCDPNAACTSLPAQQTFSCTCNTGFVGNGFTCSVSCPSIRVRRNWFSLSDTDKDTFVRAMQTLFSNGQYTPLVTQHTQVTNYAHGGAPFLYWHRAYLDHVEDLVRALGGRFACFTLSYWDWTTASAGTAQLAALFQNTRNAAGQYTAIGTKDGNCFNGNHPFAGFSYNGACIRRDPQSVPDFALPSEVANAMVTTNYGSWRSTLEGWHNYVHNWVGATMSQIPNSPSDPVFWLHHTNVDHFWAIWQNCNNQQALNLNNANSNPVWSQVWETSQYRPTDNMMTWGVSSMSVLNLGNTGVNYQTTWVNNVAARCPASQRIWLQQHLNPKDLFTSSMVSSTFSGQRTYLQTTNSSVFWNNTYDAFDFDWDGDSSLAQSTEGLSDAELDLDPAVVSQLEQVYEIFKVTYLESGNYLWAIQQALAKGCSLIPARPNGSLIVSGEMLNMPSTLRQCAKGYCSDACWKLTFGLLGRNSTFLDPDDNNSTLLLPTLTAAPPLKVVSGKLVPDVRNP